jgi:hypothetical protein
MRIKKNGKVVNLTESDLQRIVKRVLKEQVPSGNPSSQYAADIVGDVQDTVQKQSMKLGRDIWSGPQGKIDYNTIENLKSPKQIVKVIKGALGGWGLQDDEAVVESAFIAMEKVGGLFDKVNKIFIQEEEEGVIPYVESAMEINQTYHKVSILNIISTNGWE